ncbi:MAG: CapA family protein [Blautia sp.]|nr:CapA family protein [Blautia sp.]
MTNHTGSLETASPSPARTATLSEVQPGAASLIVTYKKQSDSSPGNISSPETGGSTSVVTPVRSYAKDEATTIKITCCGDNILGTDENFDYSTSFNLYYEMYGKDYFLENVRGIFETDDLTVTNFEGTLTYETQREDKEFAFKGDPEYAYILSDSSVEACNTANNHSHDYGEKSYQDTLTNLKASGMVTFGYDDVAFIDVKGIKVGLLGIYELDDHLLREPQLRANMQKLKDGGADLIIAVFHWGNELEYEPDSNEYYLGRLAVDLGADLVWGSHPHVLQGIEEYKGVQIFYGLGNFCFGGNTNPYDMDTMIIQQDFTVSKEGVVPGEVTIIPARVSAEWDYNDYRPTPAEGDEYDRIMNKIEELNSYIS